MKTQSQREIKAVFWTKWACFWLISQATITLQVCCEVLSKLLLDPVSYTHLDVYKRQPLIVIVKQFVINNTVSTTNQMKLFIRNKMSTNIKTQLYYNYTIRI